MSLTLTQSEAVAAAITAMIEAATGPVGAPSEDDGPAMLALRERNAANRARTRQQLIDALVGKLPKLP